MTEGGNRRTYNSILTPSEIREVKQLIKKGVEYYDIEHKFNISASFVSSINNGVYFYDEHEIYPLYKYYKDDSDYDELIDLLLNSSYSLKEISNILNIGYSTVKKINEGKLRIGLYPTYPIRTKSANEQRADRIKHFLLTTNLSNKDIAQLVHSSEETVRRIKVGQSFKDNKLTYPLKNL